MNEGTVARTQYWNVAAGTVRSGATGHGESLTDVETYLLPLDQARGSSLFTWGVADGLQVRTGADGSGVTVSPGTALDAMGRLIVLAPQGVAVIDPDVDPSLVVEVPTVVVPPEGVALPAHGPAGDLVLTLTWREVQGQSTLANAPTLLHAPWLRLLPADGYADTGEQVPLANVGIDAAGKVTALTVGPRRLVGLPAGRIQLRMPVPAADASVGHGVGAALSADPGGVHIDVGAGPAARTALSIDSQRGEVQATTALVAPVVRVTGARSWETSASGDGGWRLTDVTAGRERMTVDAAGNLGLGVAAGAAQRSLHVEGTGVHIGGSGGGDVGGFSFADLDVGSFVAAPTNGERWVWYARAGAARLWSGADILQVNASDAGGALALDVSRRMRVREGPRDTSSGIWFYQRGPASDRAFVGMADDSHVGFWGNTGAGWGVRMDTSTREVLFGGDFGRPEGASTLSLFGSRIGDVGGGTLFIRSGGSVVAFDGGDRIGINTREPKYALHVEGGAGGGVLGIGAPGIWGVGGGDGAAGVFWGRVQIVGDLEVRGTVSKNGGGFRIDHPLAPDTKYLSHSFVESPEMLNVYVGTAVTDDDGTVTVSLPDYFDALNGDPRVQLTPVGALTLVTVDGQVRDGSFTIRSDRPRTTVAWLVTGLRHDAWAQENRIAPEEDKPADVEGRLLHADHAATQVRSSG